MKGCSRSWSRNRATKKTTTTAKDSRASIAANAIAGSGAQGSLNLCHGHERRFTKVSAAQTMAHRDNHRTSGIIWRLLPWCIPRRSRRRFLPSSMDPFSACEPRPRQAPRFHEAQSRTTSSDSAVLLCLLSFHENRSKVLGSLS